MNIKHIAKLGLLSALLTIFVTPVFANENHGKSHHHVNTGENDEHNGKSGHLPNMFKSANEHGIDATFSTTGSIDLNNPFFKNLGTNGRSCATCHVPSEGWTITPKGAQKRFYQTDGLDPLFRLVDGANSPIEDIATVDERRNAYSMLLNKANIRVGIGIPAGAEFELIEVDDPYGFASATELSLYRRPLPTTNLKFLNAVMWEGRETTLDENSSDCLFGTSTCFSPVSTDLATQANHATLGHAEAIQELTTEQREAIVEFESSLFTAQIYDNDAGKLTTKGAKGGPKMLKEIEYYLGINDTVDVDYHTGESFNPIAMTLYDAWDRYNPNNSHDETDSHDDGHERARAAIVRGQNLFNAKPILISGVGAEYGVIMPFSRLHESEADMIGLDLMAKAGFNPIESVTLWQKMAQASQGAQPAEFLSTHPSHATRIEDLQAHMPKALKLKQQANANGKNPRCVKK